MKKEEKIKEAWGVLKPNYKNINLNDGWSLDTFKKVNFELFDFRCASKGSYIRPKSLQGIENNNGWIKIESEADLPKQNIDCWFVIDNDSYLGYFTKRGYFVNGSDDIELRFVTHYKPIEKPKPPIY